MSLDRKLPGGPSKEAMTGAGCDNPLKKAQQGRTKITAHSEGRNTRPSNKGGVSRDKWRGCPPRKAHEPGLKPGSAHITFDPVSTIQFSAAIKPDRPMRPSEQWLIEAYNTTRDKLDGTRRTAVKWCLCLPWPWHFTFFPRKPNHCATFSNFWLIYRYYWFVHFIPSFAFKNFVVSKQLWRKNSSSQKIGVLK